METEQLTQLELEMHKKIKEIRKLNATPRYVPKRVEPGIAYDLIDVKKWSRYMGETLFINQEILSNNSLRNTIFWREAFLLLAPLEMREINWVIDLANIFPFCLKLTKNEEESWKKIWNKVYMAEIFNKEFLQQLAKTVGSEGLIKILRIGIQRTYFILNTKAKIGKHKSRIPILNKKELVVIYNKIFHESIGLTDQSIEILKVALAKQTIKPNALVKFINKSRSTVSKQIKRLIEMNILLPMKTINLQSLNLTRYFVIMNYPRKRNIFSEKPLDFPFLISQRIYCINNCFSIHIYFGPNSSDFFNLLKRLYSKLEEEGEINEFYIFNAHNIITNYLFKYYNPKTNQQLLNFNDIAIECNILTDLSLNSFSKEDANLGNIIIEHLNTSIPDTKIDSIDIEIINELLGGNFTRRGIQKKIRKDMNETVNRIKILEEKNIVLEDIRAVLPNSNAQISLFVEDNQKKSRNQISLIDRLKHLCHHLPNVIYSEMTGSFDGLMLHAYMPNNVTLEFGDFINWFIPKDIKLQLIISSPIFEKTKYTLPVRNFQDGQWLFDESDFNW